jgi:hypothetical protein
MTAATPLVHGLRSKSRKRIASLTLFQYMRHDGPSVLWDDGRPKRANAAAGFERAMTMPPALLSLWITYGAGAAWVLAVVAASAAATIPSASSSLIDSQ